LRPDHPAYVIYTSGSTGRPKGVVVPGTGLMNLLAWHRAVLPSGEGKTGRKVAQFTAISFDVSVQEILSSLLDGKTLCVPLDDVRRHPPHFLRWLEHHAVNELFAPTLLIEALAEAADEQACDLDALNEVVQAGEALTLGESLRDLCRRQPRRQLRNHYGPAETHVATAYDLPEQISEWPASAPIGSPIWNTRVYVLDAALQPVPVGV
ncbi:MAG: non-ribosomal peptide synthetase, partial [Mesorhizobium sp.]